MNEFKLLKFSIRYFVKMIETYRWKNLIVSRHFWGWKVISILKYGINILSIIIITLLKFDSSRFDIYQYFFHSGSILEHVEA